MSSICIQLQRTTNPLVLRTVDHAGVRVPAVLSWSQKIALFHLSKVFHLKNTRTTRFMTAPYYVSDNGFALADRIGRYPFTHYFLLRFPLFVFCRIVINNLWSGVKRRIRCPKTEPQSDYAASVARRCIYRVYVLGYDRQSYPLSNVPTNEIQKIFPKLTIIADVRAVTYFQMYTNKFGF